VIVWGSKNVFPLRGYAAGFCPFCRDLRQLKVQEIRNVSHIYFIPMGKGTLVGYRTLCMECGVPLISDEPPAEHIVPTPASDVREAIELTNPSLPEELTERLAMEREIRSGQQPNDPEVREALLYEPFEALVPAMEQGSIETRVDLPSSLGCLGTIGAIILVFAAFGSLAELIWGERPSEEAYVFAVLGVGVIGLAITLWQLHLSARRWLEKHLVHHLSRALRPLRATQAEIDEIIAVYRQHGLKFAKALRSKAFDLDPATDYAAAVQQTKPISPR
jgi:hypothetical protein